MRNAIIMAFAKIQLAIGLLLSKSVVAAFGGFMKRLFAISALLLAFTLPSVAQSIRLSLSDQKRFDSYYSRWQEYRRTNNSSEVVSMEKRMQDVYRHYGIPAGTPYGNVASSGNRTWSRQAPDRNWDRDRDRDHRDWDRDRDRDRDWDRDHDRDHHDRGLHRGWYKHHRDHDDDRDGDHDRHRHSDRDRDHDHDHDKDHDHDR